MDRRFLAGAFCLALLSGWILYHEFVPYRYDIRDRPLAHPIAVVRVSDGDLHLADGRVVRPAGVTLPIEPAAREAAMQFIRLATQQGVEVRSDLGDGSAMLVCEPLFYNWCGTGRVGGWYIPCGLSELLVVSRYGPVAENMNLPQQEADRVLTAAKLRDQDGSSSPMYFTERRIRYGGIVGDVARIDEYIEVFGPAKAP